MPTESDYTRIASYFLAYYSPPGPHTAAIVCTAPGGGIACVILFRTADAPTPAVESDPSFGPPFPLLSFPEHALPWVIDLLRNEGPVHLTPPGGPGQKYMLHTEMEPIGEAELLAALAATS